MVQFDPISSRFGLKVVQKWYYQLAEEKVKGTKFVSPPRVLSKDPVAKCNGLMGLLSYQPESSLS